MQHPDEGMIHAWLDGALTVEEANGVEAHTAQCDQCSAAIAEARGLVAASSRILLALDDVPRGVIPAVTAKRRAWYARNDLRAAAAVLLVAGASLVVTRDAQDVSRRADYASATTDRGASTAEGGAAPRAMNIVPPSESRDLKTATAQALESSAARSADVESGVVPQRAAPAPRTDVTGSGRAPDKSVSPAEAVSASVFLADADSARLPSRNSAAASIARGAQTTVAGTAQPTATAQGAKVEARDEADLSGKAVAERKAAEPTPTRRFGSAQLDEVVVTGAAREKGLGAGVSPLRILRADTVQLVRTTVYEASRGVEVTLTERDPTDSRQRSALRGRAAGAAANTPSAPLASPAAAPPVVANQATTGGARSERSGLQVNSISWIDPATGRSYTLSGVLEREQLEALKARIIEQSGSR
ncbi:MAG: zf-HC2 domain-containing protein [Gemmatimonadaceae bacterium]